MIINKFYEMIEGASFDLNKAYTALNKQYHDLFKKTSDLKAENDKLKKEIEGWYRYKENIDQALNTGDGVYRP